MTHTADELRKATWNSEGELSKIGYTDQGRRSAFRAGYSDRFFEALKWSGNSRDFYPDAYNAGWGAAEDAIAAAEAGE